MRRKSYLKKAGSSALKVTPEDLKIMSEPVDFVGINVLQTDLVRAGLRQAVRIPGGSVQYVTSKNVLVMGGVTNE